MMDCGFSIAETKERLERVGLTPSDLAGIVVTHEHDDHLGGVAAFAKKYAIPVYLTRGTGMFLPVDFPAVLVCYIDSHASFAVDALAIDPIPVPHDAREPVQFVFSDGASRLGVALWCCGFSSRPRPAPAWSSSPCTLPKPPLTY